MKLRTITIVACFLFSLSSLAHSAAEMPIRRHLVRGAGFKLAQEGHGPFDFGVERGNATDDLVSGPVLEAVDDNGNYYLGDAENRRVLIFSNEGQPKCSVDYSILLTPGCGMLVKVTYDGQVILETLDKHRGRYGRIVQKGPYEYVLETREIVVPEEFLQDLQNTSSDYSRFCLDPLSSSWLVTRPNFSDRVEEFQIQLDGKLVATSATAVFREESGYAYKITRATSRRKLEMLDTEGRITSTIPNPGHIWVLGDRLFIGKIEMESVLYRRYNPRGDVIEEILCRDMPNLVSPNGKYVAWPSGRITNGRHEVWVIPYTYADVP